MNKHLIQGIENELSSCASKKRAAELQWFFKTKPGEYGEGDVFIGINMPVLRSIAKKFLHIGLKSLQFFIRSKIHEYRSFALICLEYKYSSAFRKERELRSECARDGKGERSARGMKSCKSAKGVSDLENGSVSENSFALKDVQILKDAGNSENMENAENVLSIVRFYTDNVDYINNWDLVDISAPKILGHFCYYENYYGDCGGDRHVVRGGYESDNCLEDNQDNAIDDEQNRIENHAENNKLLRKSVKCLLDEYADSDDLWKNRIAVVSTLYLIKNGHFDLTMKYAKKLMHHKHDLMHKAVGWMLREIGNKNVDVLRSFLNEFASVMPRTMLRYAIEKLSNRKSYLAIKKVNSK